MAFAKLVEPKPNGFSYEMTSLSVTLGRKTKKPDPDIVALSTLKNISRKHISIWFDAEKQQWMVKCHGKNGARVGSHPDNMLYLQADQERPLQSGSRVEIGEFWFYFLLPKSSVVQEPTPSPVAEPSQAADAAPSPVLPIAAPDTAPAPAPTAM
ncbi:hypothetical protein PAPYR_1221 [Paratrimastix pyriformis]|uniref:FHA domain-containing protein n=1 Tax=Paratrimastix pyriformis TaxID=342808 RepID=A0ABQ8UT94_9EUKA|nr:hypothetical protein PAPYR_1221 [Paratrimastix pyriformis]